LRISPVYRLLLNMAVLLMWAYAPAAATAESGKMLLITPPGDQTLNSALPLMASYLTNKVDGLNHFHPVISKSYHETGKQFESGKANAFYGGSFLGYILCARGLAVPIARGEDLMGTSNYHSVMISRRNTPFNDVESLKGKRISYVTESSSGEIYARKLFNGKDPATMDDISYVPSKSHELAIRYLRVGRADFALVKNLVWKELQGSYPDLQIVAEDSGENPNDLLLVSTAVYAEYGEALKKVILNIHSDPDPLAKQLLAQLNLKKFIVTTYPESFNHTAQLVRDAGIDANTYQFAN
jgi:ABC-type phosphate/phosphonate transport system substrate-binding protein